MPYKILNPKCLRTFEKPNRFEYPYKKVPGHTDFVIAHSTVAGFYSWRNTVQGSWYMQALTRVLAKERQQRDLLSMLTNVNKVLMPDSFLSFF